MATVIEEWKRRAVELDTRYRGQRAAVHQRQDLSDVGNALLEIRDGRLYRSTHGTFEDYCRERWGMVRQQANRLIAAAEVTANLEPFGSILPESESHARPLARLAPDEQRAAWQEAVETAPNGRATVALEIEAAELRDVNGAVLGLDGDAHRAHIAGVFGVQAQHVPFD